jgi:hypothetical protein
MLKTIRSELESLGWIIRVLAMAAVAGAVYQELKQPPEQRTWHGTLLGVVPYDFRLPTPAKVLNAWWNPRSSRVVGDPVFGVGWSLNLAALTQRMRSDGPGSAGSGSSRTAASKSATRTAA